MSGGSEFGRAGSLSMKMALSIRQWMERHAGDVLVVSPILLG